MDVTVIGSGYVGLVAATCLAEIGHNVRCIDRDAAKIDRLRQGGIPIFERHLEVLVHSRLGDTLRFCHSDELPAAARASRVIVLAVGTPVKPGGEVDLQFVHEAVEDISQALSAHPFDHKVVVEKSTVAAGTGDAFARRLPRRVDVVSNPEFLREGTAVTDFLYPDRIVVGAASAAAFTVMRELYLPLLDGSYARRKGSLPAPDGARLPARLLETSIRSAELIKHSANAFLATKISFINAISVLCELTGADIEDVARGIGMDTRIGERFLRAGIGYGGSCFPKDLAAFRALADRLGYDFDLLAEVERINVDQRQHFIERVRSAFNGRLRGKRLAVLGLSFKPDTGDLRDSPALDIVRALAVEGARIHVYDPVVTATDVQRQINGLESRLVFARNPYEAAQDADAVLVLTEWDEFALLDLDRLRAALRNPLMIDGRNLFSPGEMAALGFTYLSIGRRATIVERRATGTTG